MGQYLPMTEKEAKQLAWIHSNKFTIPDLYWKKFLPGKTFQYACRVLKNYASPRKGFLHVLKPHKFMHSYYYLTGGALRTLDGMGTALVRTTKYPVKINPYEREHDQLVQEIRIYFEACSDLDNIVWLSDFEMRSGITMEAKVAFQDGTLDIPKWRDTWARWRNRSDRTPDAYFEADWNGDRMTFTLEFEHTPYSEKMFNRMVRNLEYSFPNAVRMIVSANEKNSVRMMRVLQAKLRESQLDYWMFSDMECVRTQIFKKLWSFIGDSEL